MSCYISHKELTEDELELLRLAFALVGTVVEAQRQGNCDVYMSNTLFSLKDKLGIADLLE